MDYSWWLSDHTDYWCSPSTISLSLSVDSPSNMNYPLSRFLEDSILNTFYNGSSSLVVMQRSQCCCSLWGNRSSSALPREQCGLQYPGFQATRHIMFWVWRRIYLPTFRRDVLPQREFRLLLTFWVLTSLTLRPWRSQYVPPKRLLNFYHITRRHIPDDSISYPNVTLISVYLTARIPKRQEICFLMVRFLWAYLSLPVSVQKK
jgi:hypothetical protein